MVGIYSALISCAVFFYRVGWGGSLLHWVLLRVRHPAKRLAVRVILLARLTI